jgi:hypothetical protein
MIADNSRGNFGGGTKSRLGSILYGAGLFGAAICVLFLFDAISVHQSGESLLPISGRFLTRQDMVVTIAVAAVLALLSWRAGVAARNYVNRSAEKRRAAPKGLGVTVTGRDLDSIRDTEPSQEPEDP